MGTAIAGAFGAFLATGQLEMTAGVPTSSAERDRFFREGKLPFAVKVGGQWIQFSQLQPLNQTLTVLSSYVDAVRNNKNPAAAAQLAVTTIAQNLADQTYMSGLSNLMEAINDPQRYGENLFNRTATGFIPYSGTMRFAATVVDPTMRKPEGLLETVKAGIPGLSEQVPPRVTAFGEEVERRSPPYSPIQITSEQQTAVDGELEQYGVEIGFVGDSIGGRELNREEKLLYQKAAGQWAYQSLVALTNLPQYQEMTAPQKATALESVITDSREEVREGLIDMMKTDEFKELSIEEQGRTINLYWENLLRQLEGSRP